MNATKTRLLLEALDKRWENYYDELKACRREAAEETVHDLRVATRRLLSIIDLLRAIAPNPQLQRLRKNLRSQLDKFEELRDTQVIVTQVCEALEGLPEAKPFLSRLEKREKQLARAIEKQIRASEAEELKKNFKSVRKYAVQLAEEDGALDRHLLDAVDDIYFLVLHCSSRLDRKQPATIHRLRIAFRKFRYLVEIVHPGLSGYPQENLGLMHDFQGAMGDIQDIETLLDILSEYDNKKSSFDPEPIRRYFQQRHAETIEAFFKIRKKLKTFWRPSPEVAFPWNVARKQQKSSPKAPPAKTKGNTSTAEEKSELQPSTTPADQENIP